MKNNLKIIAALSIFAVSASAVLTLPKEVLRTDADFTPTGDLNGSANVKSNGYCGIHYSLPGEALGQNDVYLRFRNNTANSTTVLSHMNSRNNARVTLGGNKTYYTFDSAGANKSASTTDSNGFISLPASFDGFIEIPYDSYVPNTGWSSLTFNYNDLYAIYFEGAFVNVDLGDLFTTSKALYDGSETLYADFPTKIVNDFGDDIKITMNPGWKEPVTPDFDYTKVNIADNISGGARITCSRDATNNDFAAVTITLPTTVDLSSALALTMRVKAVSGSYPMFFQIFDANNNSLQCPANSSKNKIKYLDGARTSTVNVANGGNDHSIFYPDNGDGTLIFELAKMEKLSGTIDLTKVKKFVISVAVFFDYGFACIFGDMGYVVESSKTWTNILDVSELTFADVYTVTAFEQYISIQQFVIANNASWQGDVKVLNKLDFANDEELHTKVTWNEGDNACSYSVEGDAMRVHIGPYEIGHQYGSYMALKISNDAKYDDYTFANKTSSDTVLGKGLSMYVKNCSRKTIGINLQFDEKINSSAYERWILKGYPAMYYAYDIVKDAEYTFFSNSDQFQIPVGFEGYVRVPFDQMQVPDWCIPTPGVDQELDITKWNKEFYLTSDNTRYEDLEFLIKNIGVYFNDTFKANMFDNSHGIKANMGL